MKEKIKKWKKQLLCMGISVVLGAVAWIVQDMDPVIKEGNVLERPEAEDSYKEYPALKKEDNTSIPSLN